jgi:hypothetical protein
MVVDRERYRITANTVPEGQWDRQDIRMEPADRGITTNAVLVVPLDAGPERIACSAPNSQLEAGLEAAIRALGPEEALRP